MKHVLLIAVGGIGFRHFQALLNCKTPFDLYVADISETALDKARVYAETAASGRYIRYITAANELEPMNFDLVIIATSSLPRRAVFEEFAARHSTKVVYFEKVLFPCVEDYAAVEAILEEKHIRAYVNCVRRTWDVYAMLREKLLDAKLIHANVCGTEWGLGCNALHMIDLFDYLAATEAKQVCCSGEMLENTLFTSKRQGYVEFYGTLAGKIADRLTYTVSCNHGTEIDLRIEIITDTDYFCIEEGKGIILRTSLDGKHKAEQSFAVPFVSQSTTGVADSLLNDMPVRLADFTTSARLHLPVLKAFLSKQNEILGKEETRCAIT